VLRFIDPRLCAILRKLIHDLHVSSQLSYQIEEDAKLFQISCPCKVAKSVDLKSELVVCFRMLVVDVGAAKASIVAAALAARAALQEWVEGRWHAENLAIVARWVARSQTSPAMICMLMVALHSCLMYAMCASQTG
jgi:hypothetical protein